MVSSLGWMVVSVVLWMAQDLATAVRAASRMSIARSIYATVVINGGVSVSTLPMVVLNDRPCDIAWYSTASA